MDDRVTVLTPAEGESWSAFLRRIRGTKDDVIVVLSAVHDEELLASEHDRAALLSLLQSVSSRVRLVTRSRDLVAMAREKGIRVFDHLDDVRRLLAGHPQLSTIIRTLSPALWRQQLRSKLQAIGVLSLPKVRVWVLIAVSIILFGFVIFRLLPSADITVTPRNDTVSQTANIFLVQSGALVDLPDRVRSLELKPIVIRLHRSMTFDQVSREFIGQNARAIMTVHNESSERYTLRSGSRLQNQAGMVFRTQEPIFVDPDQTVHVEAVADPEDVYGEIVGERGNVPGGVRWDFPGLRPETQRLVYAINAEPASGGVSEYRTVLNQRDVELAERQLKQQLLSTASQMVDEEILLYNEAHPNEILTRLYYDELTRATFTGFVLPLQFVGEPVLSVPVEGGIIYTAYAYDAQYILTRLSDELKTHVESGKHLLPESLRLDRLVTHVINYENDLSWIKLTVDLSGTQQPILDPLTPSGARFAKRIRESVLSLTVDEAKRIIRNYPEVERVNISLWPPWQRVLPRFPYHIRVTISSS